MNSSSMELDGTRRAFINRYTSACVTLPFDLTSMSQGQVGKWPNFDENSSIGKDIVFIPFFGSLPAVTLTFDLWSQKLISTSTNSNTFCDQNLVNFPLLVFKVRCSQGFGVMSAVMRFGLGDNVFSLMMFLLSQSSVPQTTQVVALKPTAVTRMARSRVPVYLDSPEMDLPVEVTQLKLALSQMFKNFLSYNRLLLKFTLYA